MKGVDESVVLETDIWIDAPRDRVFDYLTDPRLHLEWMGREAEIEARPGGRFRVVINDQFTVLGRFLIVERPARLSYTWGMVDNEVVPPGATRVEFQLSQENNGTRLSLRHIGITSEDWQRSAPGVWEGYLAELAGLSMLRRV